MFKKISSIIAAVAITLSGFGAMPANASSASNAGAVKKSSWSQSWSTADGVTSSSTSSSITVVSGTSDWSSYVNVTFGSDDARALAGHVIRVQWNQTFPSGVTFSNGQYGSAGVNKYLDGSGGGGYWPSYSDLHIQTNSTDAGDPAGSSLITVPSNVSNLSTNQTFSLALGISANTWGGNGVVAGNYTIAPTLYDKTAGSTITLDATSAVDNTWVDGKNYTQNGAGEYTATIPAGGNLNQSLVTCVAKSSLVEGHVLTLERLADGVLRPSPQWDYTSIEGKGTNTYVGNFYPNYTVTAAQAGAEGKGLRTSLTVNIDNTAGSTAMAAPVVDVIVRDTTSNTQLESSCAAEAPGRPTFTMTSRTQGTIAWTKIAADEMNNGNSWDRNTSYNYAIYKATDLNTPVNTGSFYNATPNGDAYSQSVYFENDNGIATPLDVDTDYVAKLTAVNDYDQVASVESVASLPSSISAPPVPAAPSFTLNSLTSATLSWTKVAGDVANQWNGRTVFYSYAIYKESAPTVAVVQGNFMNPTLTGDTYSSTFNFPMSGPPNWTTITLEANTQYIAKIRSSNNNGDSAYSAASTHYQIAGPATPNKPVITNVTVSQITATVAVRTGENNFSYRAYAYAQSDSTFSNPLGEGSCMAATMGGLSYTCSISSMMTGFNAPNLYVVRVVATNNSGMSQLSSLPSPASDAVIGGVPGVSITTPSNGTTAGDAKTITSAFPGITDSFGGSMGSYIMPKGSFISDGIGNVYTFADAGVDGSVGRKFDLKKVKSDFTGYDSAFGTSGKVSTTVQFGTGNTDVMLPSVWMFAKNTKMAMYTYVSNCSLNGPCMSDSTYTFREATPGQAFGTPVNMAGKALSFCTSNVSQDFGTPSYGYFSSMSGFQGLSRPVAMVTCSKTDNVNFNTVNERFAATIGTDGSFTKLFTINSNNATQNGYYRYSVSFNPSATAASDVAAVVYLVRYKSVNNVNSNWERVIIRVKVDGSVTESPAELTVSGSEPTVTLAPVNDGTTVYAIINASGQNKFSSIPVASGGLAAGTAITIADAPMMGSVSLTFPTTGAPVVNGKVAFIRSDTTMSSKVIAPLSYNISTGAVVTGEALTYSVSGSPVYFGIIDAAGHMNFIYTPNVAQDTLVHSVIQWKNVRDMVAVPTPAVSMPGTYFSLNAGGTSITVQGVNLNETSAAKKVTGIKFGLGAGNTGLVTTITKAATSITVKIPTSVIAGATTVPTAAAPFTVPVSVVLGGGGTLSAGTVTYVGATKLAQNVTLDLVTTAATTATPDRVVTANVGNVVPAQASIPVPAEISTTTPAVCSIVAGKVRFLSNGNCFVKAVKAGNDWLAEGSVTSVAIPVLKADAVTAEFSAGETPNEGLSEDDAIAPVITLASGRTDYTMTSADTSKCSINPDTKMIWFKAGNQNCVITIATPAANAQWAAVSYTWTIAMQPPVGGAGSPLLVRNDNVMVKLPGLALKWNQKTNQVYFVTRVKWIGPVQAKMTFTDLDGAEQSCVVNFGTLKKTPLPANGDPFILTSPALCSDTKSVLNKVNTAAEKAAQTVVYNKFKALVASKTAAGESTSVQFTYRRELHRATDYAFRNPGETLLTKEWSTPTYASLYYKAIDSISAALPSGVPAAVSATADGAFVPVVTLESKRLDYTMTSSDTTKCEVLTDGRIWAKVAGQNCVITIGTGANAVWAGKSFTWTIPMVEAIGANSGSALIAPSDATAVNLGPLTVTWKQSTNQVVTKFNSINAGLVRVRMQFTDLNNVVHNCIAAFGAKKIATTPANALKTQTSPALCAGADLVAFKALVTARKSGVGMGVIPVTFNYQFEQYNPITGVQLAGQVVNSDAKPWSAGFFVKLNYRATNN